MSLLRPMVDDPGTGAVSYSQFSADLDTLDPIERALTGSLDLDPQALIYSARIELITPHRRPRLHTHHWKTSMVVGSVLRDLLRREGKLSRIDRGLPASGLDVIDPRELQLLPGYRLRSDMRHSRCTDPRCAAVRAVAHVISLDPVDDLGLDWMRRQIEDSRSSIAAAADLINQVDAIDPDRRGGTFRVDPHGRVQPDP